MTKTISVPVELLERILDSTDKTDSTYARNSLRALLAQPAEQPSAASCAACEDSPSGDNVPCAVCGKQPSAANQYPLPDDLYPGSKDWQAADYAGRVEWLHAMYESKKREIEHLENALIAKQELEAKNAALVEALEFVGGFIASDYVLEKIEDSLSINRGEK